MKQHWHRYWGCRKTTIDYVEVIDDLEGNYNEVMVHCVQMRVDIVVGANNAFDIAADISEPDKIYTGKYKSTAPLKPMQLYSYKPVLDFPRKNGFLWRSPPELETTSCNSLCFLSAVSCENLQEDIKVDFTCSRPALTSVMEWLHHS